MTAATRLLSRAAVAALLAGAPLGAAQAAGYFVKETSATLQGQAYAGAAAGGSDISAIFNNPAAAAMHGEGMKGVAAAALLLPSTEITVNGATTKFGTAIGGARSAESDGVAVVPSTYGAISLTPDLHLGLGITAPFGLAKDYGRTWAGRYHATSSELLTINVNPVIAYRVNPMITLGGGFVAQYAEATLENSVDYASVAALGAANAGAPAAAIGALAAQGGNPVNDGYAKVEGDDWGFGFTVGAVVEPMPGLRFGASYRSEVDHELEGSVDFTSPGAGATLTAGEIAGVNAVLADQAASSAATIPAQIQLGVAYDVTPQLTLGAEADWTQWSSFEDLTVLGAAGQQITTTTQNWDDSWFFSVGGEYRHTDKLTLRMGLAYDQGAAPDSHRTPRIPDADRWWLSLGAGYEVMPGVEVNAAYTYVGVEDAAIALTSAPLPASDENNSRGNLSANAEGSVHILMLNGVINF